VKQITKFFAVSALAALLAISPGSGENREWSEVEICHALTQFPHDPYYPEIVDQCVADFRAGRR
jgi:hypothetical protein